MRAVEGRRLKVQGSRLKVKGFLFVCFVSFCFSSGAQMLETRTIIRTNDIGRTRQKDAFEWFSGETVNYIIHPRQNGAPLMIPTNTTPLWYVVDATLTNYFVYQTGAVVNALGGPVEFTLSSDQSPLPPDLYESVVAIYGGNPTGQPPMVVIDRTQVRVNWSADYRGLFIGPSMPTNIVLDGYTTVFNSFWTQNADAISQALGILDAGSLQSRLLALETDLPLYSNALHAADTAEETARIGADASLSNSVGILSGQVDSNLADRVAADHALSNSVAALDLATQSLHSANAAETSARIAADATLTTGVNTATAWAQAGSNLAATAMSTLSNKAPAHTYEKAWQPLFMPWGSFNEPSNAVAINRTSSRIDIRSSDRSRAVLMLTQWANGFSWTEQVAGLETYLYSTTNIIAADPFPEGAKGTYIGGGLHSADAAILQWRMTGRATGTNNWSHDAVLETPRPNPSAPSVFGGYFEALRATSGGDLIVSNKIRAGAFVGDGAAITGIVPNAAMSNAFYGAANVNGFVSTNAMNAAISNEVIILAGVVDSNAAARIAADAALSNSVTLLSLMIGDGTNDINSLIQSNEAARIAADASLSNSTANLTGQIGTNLAAMIAADAALSNAVTGLIQADASISNLWLQNDQRLDDVEQAANDAQSWGNHADAGYADADSTDALLDRKAWRKTQASYFDWIVDYDVGNNYSEPINLVLTNGAFAIEVVDTVSGDFVYGLASPITQNSGGMRVIANGTTPAVTRTNLYFAGLPAQSLLSYGVILGFLLDDSTNFIHRIRIYEYADALESPTNDFRAIQIFVDDPYEAENPVNLRTLDTRLAGVPSDNWYNFPALAPVEIGGYPLRLGENWDHVADTNSYRIRYNQAAFMTFMPGVEQLVSTGFARIASYAATASNILIGVEHPPGWYPAPITSTNGEDWVEVSALDYTSSWPTQFNGETRLNISMPVTDATLIGIVAYPTNITQDSRIVQVDAEVFRIRNGILEVLDESANVAARLSATGGLRIGAASFYVFPSGDIKQGGTNTAQLGMTFVHSLVVTGETGRILVGTNEVAYTHELSGNWQAAADTLAGEIGTNLAAMIAADATLSNAVDLLAGVVDTNLAAMIAADAALSNAISAEATARIGSAAALSNTTANLSGEIGTNLTAMLAADAALSNAVDLLSGVVDTNLAAMIAADAALSNAVGVLTTDLGNATNTLAGVIETNLAAMIAADAALSNTSANLSAEIGSNLTAMVDADAALSNGLAAANSSIATASNAVDLAIGLANTNRIAADAALSNSLATITTDLGNATNALYGLIDTNLTALLTAEAALSNAVGVVSTNLQDAVQNISTNTDARRLQGQPASAFVNLVAWQSEMTNQVRYVETWPAASTNLGALLEFSNRRINGTNEVAIYLPNVLGPGTNGWLYLEGFTR